MPVECEILVLRSVSTVRAMVDGWLFDSGISPLLSYPPPHLLPPRAGICFFLHTQEQSSGLFTLGVVSYCLGVALLCERLNLSHEVQQ